MSDLVESSDQKGEVKAKREIIQLLVGDHLFRVDKRILLSEEGTFFKDLLSEQDGDKPIIIERNHQFFSLILDHMRTKSKFICWGWNRYDLDRLEEEADFYGLSLLDTEISNLLPYERSTPVLGMKQAVVEIHLTDEVSIERRVKMTGKPGLLFSIRNKHLSNFKDMMDNFRKLTTFSDKLSKFGLFVKIVEPNGKCYVNIIDPWMGDMYENGNPISDINNDSDMQRLILWLVVDYERRVNSCSRTTPNFGFVYEYIEPEVKSDEKSE